MKELKDYLHLYLGCDMILKRTSHPIAEIKDKITTSTIAMQGISSMQIIPILRPLSDITEQEMNDLKWDKQELEHAISQKRNPNFYNTEFLYLLKNGFDLFRLIEAGLAIDKTTLR